MIATLQNIEGQWLGISHCRWYNHV